jgi:hypothetical protein
MTCSRRSFLGHASTLAALPLFPLARAARGDVREELDRILAGAEELDGAPAHAIAHDPRWEARLQDLIGRAEALARRAPREPAAWFALARCRWIDVDSELERPRALRCIEAALRLDADFRPALVLGQEIAGFTALVLDDHLLRERSRDHGRRALTLQKGGR